MPDLAFRAQVEQYARLLCASRRVLADGDTADQARRYADRHWRQFVDMALDLMALEQAAAEADAAPRN